MLVATELFENGADGIYKRISETGSTANKTADLNDPEICLGDDVTETSLAHKFCKLMYCKL